MLFCEVCGDNVKVVYPCKFIFHDGITVNINICLGCYDSELTIDLGRKRLVGKILNRFSNLNK